MPKGHGQLPYDICVGPGRDRPARLALMEEDVMPIYLVRWPDLSASLVRAESEEHLLDILDQVANPDGCEWSIYEGPLFIDLELPAKWSIRDERPGEPVAPDQVVVGDVGSLATRPVAEAMEVALGGCDEGLDTAKEVLRTAFPMLHAAIESRHESGADDDFEGVLPEAEIRAALRAELVRRLQWSWRQAQLLKKDDVVSALAREMDLPVALARRFAEMVQGRPKKDDDDEPPPV